MPLNEAAIKELLDLAQFGNMPALCRLGDLFSTGGLREPAKVIEYYQRAADLGYARAQVLLAQMYASGRGLEKNLRLAADWYSKAADQGDARAILALLSFSADVKPPISQTAVAKCKQAANSGNREAQYCLGLLHEQGIGIEKDPSSAARMYYKAALRGQEQARQRLEALRPRDQTATSLAEQLNLREHYLRKAEAEPGRAATHKAGTGGSSARRCTEDMSRMTGVAFEECIKALLRKSGWNVDHTPGSGDMGADLVIRRNGKMIVVQCKRYSKAVGVQAVQEVLGAKSFYQAQEACVITNSTFTQAAQTLARSARVRLIDGTRIQEDFDPAIFD